MPIDIFLPVFFWGLALALFYVADAYGHCHKPPFHITAIFTLMLSAFSALFCWLGLYAGGMSLVAVILGWFMLVRSHRNRRERPDHARGDLVDRMILG